MSQEENRPPCARGSIVNVAYGPVGSLVQAGAVHGSITISGDGTVQVGGRTVAPPAGDEDEGMTGE